MSASAVSHALSTHPIRALRRYQTISKSRHHDIIRVAELPG